MDLEIKIRDEFIKLGQALKLAGVVEDGVEAKYAIQDGLVQVNGEVDERRGRKVYAGDVITYENQEIKVIHTPGHTPGSVCFLFGDALITGDTLFYGSIGRTDFEGGSFAQISDSIQNKLFKLDENITVYPGHDAQTTIGYEKKYNSPFGKNN